MSARDALSQSLWDNYTRSEKNAFIDAHRDEVALEIGRDALRDGLAPTLIRLVGEANATKLMTDSRDAFAYELAEQIRQDAASRWAPNDKGVYAVGVEDALEGQIRGADLIDPVKDSL